MALWLLPALPFLQHLRGTLARHRVEKQLRRQDQWPADIPRTNHFDAAARLRGERVAMLLTNEPRPWNLPPAFTIVAPGAARPVTALTNVVAVERTREASNGWSFFACLLETNREHFENLHRQLERAPHDFGFDLSPEAWDVSADFQRSDADLWWQLVEGVSGQCRYLHAAVLLAVRDGDGDRALAALEDFVKVNDVWREQPVGVAQHWRAAGARKALALTWLLLHELSLSEEQLTSLSRLWVEGDHIRRSVDAFESDLIGFHRALEKMAGNTHRDPAQFLLGRIQARETNRLERMAEEMGRDGAVIGWRFLYGEETLASFAQAWAALRPAAQSIVKDHRASAWVSERSRLRDAWKKQGTYRFIRELPSSFFLSSILESELEPLSRATELETEIALTQAAIALQRYERAQGHYPQSLAQLVPRYLAHVPRDWQTGQPIRYACTEGRFKLYAIGWDGQDNGGSLEPRTAGAGYRNVWSGRDTVWLRRATPEEIALWEEQHSKRRHQGPAGRRRMSPPPPAATETSLRTNFPVPLFVLPFAPQH